MCATKSVHESSKIQASTEITQGLNQVLADTYALMGLSHFAHWNVEGDNFFALHAAFEEQYTNLFHAADEIAERARALNAYAPGGLKNLAKMAGMEEFEAPMPAKDYVAGLIEGHEKLVRDAKVLRALTGKKGDTETEDLMIERLRYHEKTLWMLKSFLK